VKARHRRPHRDLGFAKVDLDRQDRCGQAEVIFGSGKTPAQIAAIATELHRNGQPVLITRATRQAATAVRRKIKSIRWHEQARILSTRPAPVTHSFRIGVCAAGTSDLPVAEEAALTAEFYGNPVERIYDVGVAGIDRLLAHREQLSTLSVVVVVAGMEGALPSVVAGLVSCPILAVPTSVGYGTSYQGITPLLAMMTSCGSGVSVVNIDNGFGAGFAAARITAALARAARSRSA
jgi:NCAIR mutase (PurE)-related protein